MTARDGSASYFAELSRDLFGAPHEEPTTDAVLRRALEVVRSSQHASVTMRRGGATETTPRPPTWPASVTGSSTS